MRTSPNGLAFIETNEGFSASVYDDNGRPCIGFGHDLQPGESCPSPITREEAEQLLSADLATRFEPAVNQLVPADCTQNQFDSCVDFCYEEGPTALATMLHHGWDQVPVQMMAWVYEHVNGVLTQSAALKARRQAEVTMFLASNPG